MGMLNSLNQLLITKAFWNWCINLFVDFLGNYGWAIILFTIALKIILSPLDVLQRSSMKKQTQLQAKLQPQINKIQEQYGNDKEKLNQKMNELYKNNNMTSVCFPMLITMVITLVVFITLFNALNAIATSKDSEIFYNLHQTYVTEKARVEDNEYILQLQTENPGITNEEIEKIQVESIKSAVLKEYKTQKKKHGFLWVQNVWKSDTTTSPFVKYSVYKDYYKDLGKEIENEDVFYEQYKDIIKMVETKNSSHNGYFVLIILAGVVTFLVQYLSQLSMKKANNMTAGSTNKIMMIIMPIVMLIFAANSNALFTIYIITNSVVSSIISKIIDTVLKSKDDNDNNIKRVKSKTVVEYSRNYFKGN